MSANLKRISLIITFLIVLILDIIVTIHVSENLLDNDTSGEMVLSKCLYDEKSLICDDWNYATEVRVANQMIFAPLFGIFSDWTVVRITGTFIIQAILLFSLIFLLKAGSLQTDSILFGSTLILLPYCVAYGRITLYHCYYALYISLMFLIIGCLFYGLDRSHRTVFILLMVLLCVLGCLNGIRIAFIAVLPLCVLGFRCLLQKKKRFFYLSILCGTAAISGLALYKLIISSLFHLMTETSLRMSFKGISEIYVVIFSILRQFGYRSGIERKSLLGIMSAAGIGVCFYAVFLSGKAFFTEKNEKKLTLKSMLFIQLILTAGSFLIFDLPFNTRYDYSRYLVPASVWIIPLFCMRFEENKIPYQKICFYAVLFIFAGNGLINLCFFRNPDHFTQDYDGITFTSTKSITRYDSAVRFIEENDYGMGYAFKDVNSLSEYMDGLPVVGIIYTDGKLGYFEWLSRKSFRNIQTENVFLIADYNDARTFRGITSREDSELVYSEKNKLFIYRIKDPDRFRSYLSQ